MSSCFRHVGEAQVLSLGGASVSWLHNEKIRAGCAGAQIHGGDGSVSGEEEADTICDRRDRQAAASTQV